MEKQDFIDRLIRLRMSKGVSARDMSLSIGQSPGYIYSIESGKSYPSMSTFIYICDYLGVTPKQFFDFESKNPEKENELLAAVSGLSEEQLDALITLAKGLVRGD